MGIDLALWTTGKFIGPYPHNFFPGQLYLFLIGFLAFRYENRIPRSVSSVAAALSVLWILLYQRTFSIDLLRSDQVNFAGTNLALYALFALGLPAIVKAGDRFRYDKLVGDLSYPLYISHATVIYLFDSLDLYKTLTFEQYVASQVSVMLGLAGVIAAIIHQIEGYRKTFRGRKTTSEHPQPEGVGSIAA